MDMVILVFLQNQWFNDPERVKQMYEEHPEHRQRYIASFLFMGCPTGRTLEACWGEKLCEQVVWEESSPEICGKASACPPADLGHMLNAIIKFRPDVVVTLGAIATNGFLACTEQFGQDRFKDCELLIKSQEPAMRFLAITGPHPTARKEDPRPRLRQIGQRLQELIEQEESLPPPLEVFYSLPLEEEEVLPLGD